MFLYWVKNKEQKGLAYVDKFYRLASKSGYLDRKIIINEPNHHISLSNRNITILISGESQSLGKIMSCNDLIESLLKYESKELINRNISVILPNLYKKFHQELIQKLYNSDQVEIIHKEREVFCLSKNDYIVPVKLCLALFPVIENHVCFIAIIRKSEDYFE